MPRSRRGGRGRSSRVNEPEEIEEFEEIEELEEVEELVDYEEEDEPLAVAEAAPEIEEAPKRGRRGGRSGGARSSSRRQSATASRGKKGGKKKTSRNKKPELTAEELAEKKARTKSLVTTLIVMIVVVGVGFGLFSLMKTDPRITEFDQQLNKVQGNLRGFVGALDVRNVEEAQRLYDESIGILEVPELANATAGFNPEDPAILDEGLANRAIKLKEQFDAEALRITSIQEDNMVEVNIHKIRQQLQSIRDVEDLDGLILVIEDFRLNPVAMDGTELADARSRYGTVIDQLQGVETSINSEKSRRERTSTADVEKIAMIKAREFAGRKRYGDALAYLTQLGGEHPAANLLTVRTSVESWAKDAWESAEQRAKDEYETYKAPGTSADQRDKHLRAAKDILDEVIDNYGVDSYVDEAKDLKASFSD